MAETKVTSIRADEETTLRFKELSEQYPNNAECLKALINAHEMAQAKGVLAGQETNINDFQSHLDSIMRGYINALDMTANAENRIREEFRANLDSKDKSILNLQESLDIAEQNVTSIEEEKKTIEAEAEEQKQKLINEIDILTSKLEQAEKAQNAAEQYAKSALTASEAQKLTIDTLNEKLKLADEKTAQIEVLTTNLALAEQRAVTAENELQEYKHLSEIALERAEIDKEKAVLSERAKATERTQSLVDETKKLYTEIDELRKEILKLKESKEKKSVTNGNAKKS